MSDDVSTMVWTPEEASSWWDTIKSRYLNPDNTLNFDKIKADGMTVAGLVGLAKTISGGGGSQTVGYQGKIPELTSVRGFTGAPQLQGVGDRTGQVRPGSGGASYFTPAQYVKADDAAALAAARTKAAEGVVALKAWNDANAARQVANQELDRQDALKNNNPYGTATALIDGTKIPGQTAATGGLGGVTTPTTVTNPPPVTVVTPPPAGGAGGSGGSGDSGGSGGSGGSGDSGGGSTAAQTGFTGVQGNSPAPASEPMSKYKDLAGNYIPQRIIDAQQAYINGGAAQENAARAASDASLADMSNRAAAAGYSGPIATHNGLVGDTGKTFDELFGTTHAAQGGLMGLAKGGSAKQPRYLRGDTDGMADKIPATIEGNQPAALAHGEFVIPADVVSHLGNGNSDAGAQQLYKMMDKIRMARTGTKKQGKRINPDKFTPGGIAGYAAGGDVKHFEVGGTSTVSTGGKESSLSNWAGDYVTGLLGEAKAAAHDPNNFMTYGQAGLGPLTAGDSALQTQAYENASKLSIPDALNSAAANAGTLAQKYDKLDYKTPAAQAAAATAAAQGYNAERAAVERASAQGYNATDAEKTQLGDIPLNTYQANLQNYQMQGPQDVSTDRFYQNNNVQNYMSPYIQQVIENQQRDAQRQADIASTGRHADLVKQGAFGGSRQAIMDAEAARNLAQQKGDIMATGMQNAYQQAQQQYSTDAARALQAGTANQQAGLTTGAQNLGANLQTQALGTQTGLQAALANQQMQGQYGLTQGQLNQNINLANALAANQAAQFGAQAQNTNSMFNANLGTQTNLANAQAANQASQFGAQAANTASLQNAQLATQVNLANAAAQNQNNQFGANFGLQALAGQNAAIGLQGQLGQAQNTAGLANLNAQLTAGQQQQATTQAGINANIADFNAQRDATLKGLQFQQSFLTGLPLATQNYTQSGNTLTV